MGQGYTVILLPDTGEGWIVASVPAMPGCVSQGRTRAEALKNVLEAMTLWLETETGEGRRPLDESPSVVSRGVTEALEIIDDMRQAGEVGDASGYELELVTVQLRQPTAA